MKKTVSFSKNASNVFFHILTRCNMKCRHCYINPEQHGTETLPIQTIRAWLTELRKRTPGANLVFLGGEPTLHPDLSTGVLEAKSLGYHSITIDTNGYLFHDILERVTPDLVDYFSFSLDGATRKTNDAIRGKGSYDVCIAGLRKAVKSGFQTSLIYTVSRANISELEQMGPILSDLGVNRFFIQIIGLRGKAAECGKAYRQVSRAEWLSTIPKSAKRIAGAGITVIYPKVHLKIDEPFECAGIVADNYFIFPNGRVYRCPLCEDYPLHGLEFRKNRLVKSPKINETDLFELGIPEGCVMNKLIQPQNLTYGKNGIPRYKVACCLLKEEIAPSGS